MADPGDHIAEVSLAERYVATLFLQCRQIALLFEEPEVDQVGQSEVQRPKPVPPPRLPHEHEEEDLLLGGVESDGSSELSVGSAGSMERRRREERPPPPAPPPPPRRRPASAGASFRPGPWSDARFSEASRLQRIVNSHAWQPARRCMRPRNRERPQGKDKLKISRRTSHGSIASIFSATSIPRRERRSSVWSLSLNGDALEHKQLGHRASVASAKADQDEVQSIATTRTGGDRSIFALPGEEEDETDTKRRNGLRGRRRLTLNLRRYTTSKSRDFDASTPTGRFGRTPTGRGSSKGRVRKTAQQVNKEMEETFIRRFRTAKEADLATAAPETSEQVMSLHQLALSVNVSFDDARLIKAAFDLHASGRDHLEYVDFVQAVLHLHRTMNSACTATTLAQCESLCAVTYPGGGLDGTVDLLKLLQWYSTYSFQEELILSADMRNLRRLSRQYGVPWEEVDNVKRQFDAVDEDGSGDISVEEFGDVLRRILQVPHNLELPANRVRHFWKELDHDGSGKADFTEFLPWWLKYFHNKEGRKMLVKPFEDFYRNVRNLKNPDPPPYRQGKKVVTAAPGSASPGALPHDFQREISGFSRGISGGSGMASMGMASVGMASVGLASMPLAAMAKASGGGMTTHSGRLSLNLGSL